MQSGPAWRRGCGSRISAGRRSAGAPDARREGLRVRGGERQRPGDYEGPGFVQRCVMVAHPDLPMTVFFRPDRDSARTEVVFELGRLWSGPPRRLGPYTAEILRGGQTLAKIDVPQHFWFSRWRWQSVRRPVVKRPAALIAAGLLPPFAVQADPTKPSEHAEFSRANGGAAPAHPAPPAGAGGIRDVARR
jgi:hypothetical protein